MTVRNVMESAHLGTPRSSRLMLRYIGGYYYMRRVDGSLVVTCRPTDAPNVLADGSNGHFGMKYTVPLPAVTEITLFTPYRPPLSAELVSVGYIASGLL